MVTEGVLIHAEGADAMLEIVMIMANIIRRLGTNAEHVHECGACSFMLMNAVGTTRMVDQCPQLW